MGLQLHIAEDIDMRAIRMEEIQPSLPSGQLATLEKLFKKGPVVGWDKLDRATLPSTIHDLDGNVIPWGSPLRSKMRLPVIFRNAILCGDLIPATAWGSSLANMLTKSCWDQLRMPVIERNSGVCEYCGMLVGRSLEIHEIWEYSNLASTEELGRVPEGQIYFGRQKLRGFVGVCSDCHMCFHLGLAKVKNKLGDALHRLAVLNGWTAEYVDSYYSTIGERWNRLSDHHWIQDVGLVAKSLPGLIVSRSWKRDGISPHLLFKQSDYGPNLACIANCNWRLTNESEWFFHEEL